MYVCVCICRGGEENGDDSVSFSLALLDPPYIYIYVCIHGVYLYAHIQYIYNAITLYAIYFFFQFKNWIYEYYKIDMT